MGAGTQQRHCTPSRSIGDEFTGGRFDDNEIKTLFARIDTGNDGAIEKDELERFLVGTFDGRALPRLVRYTVHRID